jgi:DNA mismatch repair protein MutL
MPSRIRKLPDRVANQIAAGEVVERPVAVVKELVENALDAGATRIEIQFERGGKSLIRVADDGCGMNAEEAVLSLERHATSKIESADDLLSIRSLGFRGEALPSIASVSKFTLRTRVAEAAVGTEIRVDGGHMEPVRDCGRRPGTEVIVEQLFKSVPARRKFLKTDRTETAHIIQCCRLLAMAHPEVGFHLVEEGRTVFQSPACSTRVQRVVEIFGKSRAAGLMKVDATMNGIRVHGLVGEPGQGRSTRSEMITFVNLRPVNSRTLDYALIESYHRYLPHGRYPLAFLFVDIPPESVDVNVHPAKREVRFHNEAGLRSVVMQVLLKALEERTRDRLGRPVAPPKHPAGFGKEEPVPEALPRPSLTPEKQDLPPSLPPRLSSALPAPVSTSTPPRSLPPEQVDKGVGAVGKESESLVFKGIFRIRYGLFESPDGLVLLTAQGAQERILYERILRSLDGGEVPQQELLIPPLLEFPPLEAGLLRDELPFFEKLGFSLETFGRQAFRLRAHPVWMDAGEAEVMIGELIGKILERGIDPSERSTVHAAVARMIAIADARRFVPQGTEGWMRLTQQLLECEHPLVDAQGRATLVEWRSTELARKFGLDTLD